MIQDVSYITQTTKSMLITVKVIILSHWALCVYDRRLEMLSHAAYCQQMMNCDQACEEAASYVQH